MGHVKTSNCCSMNRNDIVEMEVGSLQEADFTENNLSSVKTAPANEKI